MNARSRVLMIVTLCIALMAVTVRPSSAVHSTDRLERAARIAATLDPAAGSLALDDQLPGVPLDVHPIVSRTVTGTLDAYPTEPPVDPWDVYSVHLAPGEEILLDMTGTGANFDLWLISPRSWTVQAAEFVAISDGAASSERIRYTASDLFGAGRYYIVVVTTDSEGEYTLDWHVRGRSDGNVPGRRLVARTATGTVDASSDAYDVFSLPLGRLQRLTCTLTADDPGDVFELRVVPPRFDNGGILEPVLDIHHAGEVVARKGSSAVITYTVAPEREGVHHIVISANGASGSYALAWEVTESQVPGRPLWSASETGTLEPRQVWSVPLRWGQHLWTSLWVTPTPTPATVRLWAPGTLDVEGTGTPLLQGSFPTLPAERSFTYLVPTERDEACISSMWRVRARPRTSCGITS